MTKTDKEFNLSKQIFKIGVHNSRHNMNVILPDDVKEFIKRLKETHQKLSDEIGSWGEYDRKFIKEIDKLAGDKLI